MLVRGRALGGNQSQKENKSLGLHWGNHYVERRGNGRGVERVPAAF